MPDSSVQDWLMTDAHMYVLLFRPYLSNGGGMLLHFLQEVSQ